MIDFTTVVGVDAAHLEEWALTWPTWARHRPQILDQPLLVVCDADRPIETWEAALRFLRHPRVTLVPWSQPGVSQREKMLTGLTLVPTAHVRTPWFLKLDTDVAATAPADWVPDAWFAPDVADRVPTVVAPPWGYTKPADAVRRLDDWGDTTPGLCDRPRLDLPVPTGADRVRHPRVISWCLFGRTDWLREVTADCRGRLPVPSHDTFLSYCLVRRGDFHRRVDMRSLGWVHTGSRRRLERTCRAAVAAAPGAPATAGSVPPLAPRHAVRLCRLLGETFRQSGPLWGAEIGVDTGETSATLLAAFPRLRLSLIDAWRDYPADHPYRRSRDGKAARTAGEATAARRTAETRTWFASDRREVVVTDSLAAAARVPDGTLDFAFVDADHTYKAVRADLRAWWPKVRPGGLFAGHDYGARRDRRGLWGVRRAVDEWAAGAGLPVTVEPGTTVWWVRKPDAPPASGPLRVYYLLTGASHAARLVVSLWSLRRFYAGPVTICTTLPESHLIGARCADDPQLRVEHRTLPHPDLRRNASYAAKAALPRSVPDPGGVYLDADTLVAGDPAPLFDALSDAPFVATRFADWRASGRRVRKRVEAWRPLAARTADPREFDRLIDDAIRPRPAVNSGVFGWRRGAELLDPWENLTRLGHRRFICDEVALQILLHRHPHRLLDCRFNCSPTYAGDTRDVRVWHFHGGSHLKAGRGRDVWLPAFRACLAENPAGVAEWADVAEPELAPEMSFVPAVTRRPAPAADPTRSGARPVFEIALAQHAYAKRAWWCLSALTQQAHPPAFRVRLNVHRDDPYAALTRRLVATFRPLLDLTAVEWADDRFYRRGFTRDRDLAETEAEWLLYLDSDTVLSPDFLRRLAGAPLDPGRMNVAPRITMTDFDAGYALVDAETYDDRPVADAAGKCAAVGCLMPDKRGGAGYFQLVHPATVRARHLGYAGGRRDRRFDDPRGLRVPSDMQLRRALGMHALAGLPPFYHLQHWRRDQVDCPESVRTICH